MLPLLLFLSTGFWNKGVGNNYIFFFIQKLESQDDNYKFLFSVALSIYLTDREIILLRWRVVARKHQTVGQSKVFNTQIGKCQPILEENKRVE